MWRAGGSSGSRQLCDRYGWPAPVALQQEHSYLRKHPGSVRISIVDNAQLRYLQAHDDLTLIAYSPILKGVYDDAAKQRENSIMAAYQGSDSDARLAAAAGLAAGIGSTSNQLVLAWMLHQTLPQRVSLIGPRTLEQYDKAIAALDISLEDGLLTKLDDAGS
jgi:aryl-alcohol dehydrogenase-like predicted oxidoreductase